MGYSTNLFGILKFNKQLTLDDKTFLEKLANTRRMGRNVDEKYGVEGEFYVDGTDDTYGESANIIDHNTPPKTQPGLWLQWIPTEDGWGLEWDGNEKFYDYVEWLQYLIDKVLGTKGYLLNGEIEWEGEDREDSGKIIVRDSVITIQDAKIVYEQRK